MSLQAQPKSSSKRTGKRIAFLSEQGVPGKEAQQQQQQQQQLKESQYYGHGGNVPSSQAMELSKFSGVASNAALLNSLYAQARGEPRMTPQHLAAAKWQNSPIGSRLPERSEASWQPQPGGWNHGMPYGGSQKVGHPNIGVAGFYSHPDTLKRNREKGVVVSQLDLYVDDVQQMMSQKVQLEQQALARQQAQINSFQQLQKQQQPQNQTLPLQPFQLAFGHQGQKQGLPELLHVFQQAPASSSPAFTAQQKPQALPQLQLFENFYPQQQQQQQQHHHHQQQAAVQAFGIQQPVSVAQPHMAEPSQPSQHHMASHQFHPVPERNQELLKALTEQNSQTVLPQAQIPLPRRSRRLSKEGVLPVSSAEEALESKPAEEYPGNVLPHHWQAQQHPEVQFRHPPETFGHNKESYSQQNRVESGPGEGPAGGQSNQAEMEKVRAYENAREGIKHMPVTDGLMQRANDFGVRGGVIQSTRRRRRISQEANLLTLAQKAVELASLLDVKEPETSEEKNKSDMAATAPRSVVEFAGSSPAPKKTREDSNLMPLIIPVSVPVMRLDPQDVGRDNGEDGKLQRFISNDRGLSESKPSVIVTRRRSNRNLNMDMLAQHESAAPKEEMEGFSRKPKQRPRPEPLFIPPKAGTFIAPPVYSNITPYQSHLRSPVRLADHPSDRNFELPPYTPPPILSPVREGSGLYFNAILSASGNSVPPPITPKRTLLRSNSAEVTPPVLSVMGEATPVSIEPRINVGTRFQAEIPSLRDRSLAASDKAKAELVWQPWDRLETDTSTQEHVENLVTAACSSIFPGGGTNQELAYHCLHEAKGNILTALTKLLLKKSVRLSNHPLANYHYTGSDKWSALEKKLFNKGLAIYKKDFFLVQKLIKTKTVAQCVEFYYTFKKQVKIGRNGTLIFGDADAASERAFKDEAEVDIKSSHRLTRTLPPRTYNEDYENTDDEEEEEAEEELTVKKEAIEKEELQDKHSSTVLPKPTQNLHSENPAGSLLPEKHQEPSAPRGTEARGRASKRTKEMPIKYRKSSPPAQKRRRKPKPKPDTTNKTQNQEEEFPCKKCGRIFYKVKSRSAHMKSHAEQEKKAAALKQREKEEAEAEAARSRAQREESRDTGSTSGSSSSSSDDDVEV